eukprot:753605-Hanusia_phi.AAC.4
MLVVDCDAWGQEPDARAPAAVGEEQRGVLVRARMPGQRHRHQTQSMSLHLDRLPGLTSEQRLIAASRPARSSSW